MIYYWEALEISGKLITIIIIVLYIFISFLYYYFVQAILYCTNEILEIKKENFITLNIKYVYVYKKMYGCRENKKSINYYLIKNYFITLILQTFYNIFLIQLLFNIILIVYQIL